MVRTAEDILRDIVKAWETPGLTLLRPLIHEAHGYFHSGAAVARVNELERIRDLCERALGRPTDGE